MPVAVFPARRMTVRKLTRGTPPLAALPLAARSLAALSLAALSLAALSLAALSLAALSLAALSLAALSLASLSLAALSWAALPPVGPQAQGDQGRRHLAVPAQRLPGHEHGRHRGAGGGLEADRLQELRRQGTPVQRHRARDRGQLGEDHQHDDRRAARRRRRGAGADRASPPVRQRRDAAARAAAAPAGDRGGRPVSRAGAQLFPAGSRAGIRHAGDGVR